MKNQLQIMDRKSITEASKTLLDLVEQGDVSPLNALISLKHMEETIKMANKKLKELALDEASLYGSEAKQMTIYGAEIQVRNGATRWSFDHIPEYNEKKQQLKDLESRYKQSYHMAQKGDMMISGDGEVVPQATPKPSGEVIAIKLKK